jgi:hypothetical protein
MQAARLLPCGLQVTAQIESPSEAFDMRRSRSRMHAIRLLHPSAFAADAVNDTGHCDSVTNILNVRVRAPCGA